jgi:hypothetical protein
MYLSDWINIKCERTDIAQKHLPMDNPEAFTKRFRSI